MKKKDFFLLSVSKMKMSFWIDSDFLGQMSNNGGDILLEIKALKKSL